MNVNYQLRSVWRNQADLCLCLALFWILYFAGLHAFGLDENIARSGTLQTMFVLAGAALVLQYGLNAISLLQNKFAGSPPAVDHATAEPQESAGMLAVAILRNVTLLTFCFFLRSNTLAYVTLFIIVAGAGLWVLHRVNSETGNAKTDRVEKRLTYAKLAVALVLLGNYYMDNPIDEMYPISPNIFG